MGGVALPSYKRIKKRYCPESISKNVRSNPRFLTKSFVLSKEFFFNAFSSEVIFTSKLSYYVVIFVFILTHLSYDTFTFFHLMMEVLLVYPFSLIVMLWGTKTLSKLCQYHRIFT